MNLKRLLVAIVLAAAGVFGSANAQTAPQCFSSPNPLTFSYGTGSITISYNICYPNATNSSSFYWDSTMTYDNVSFDGSFSINGSMIMALQFTNEGISSVVFNGGPLVYTIGGETYTVSFNDLTFTLNSALQAGAASGTLTINGQTTSAATEYFAYLFR